MVRLHVKSIDVTGALCALASTIFAGGVIAQKQGVLLPGPKLG